MTTNSEIISDALREIGILAQGAVADAAKAKEALRLLNRMMAMLSVKGINVGYFSQDTTNATCPVPEWAELAVITMLATALANHYGQSVSPELAGKTAYSFDLLLTESVKANMKEMSMDKLSGSGGMYNINTDLF